MGPALRRRAQRLTRSAAEAEDLAQETVLRALDAAPEFASREHLRAWLYTVLRNAFVSRRRRDRNAERAAAELTVMIEQRGPAPGPRFLTKSVERALEALPEPFASVVQLVDLEDHTYADASAALGVPIGTIMSRLFRGRQRLARALAPRDDLAR
jgi:RNA polymerase sigma-70 factor (ECF subfamily)